jgi:hypothetical protein
MNHLAPFSQPGQWYKGNLHTHSTVSDGLISPDQVIEWYRQRGYHFLALTDHRVLSASRALGDDYLLISGIEVDSSDPQAGVYHMVGLGIHGPLEIDYAQKPPMKEMISRIRSAGGRVFLAHPYWSGQMSKDLLDLDGCFGMEIWNSGCEVWEGQGFSVTHWDDVLNHGCRIWGLGTDDCHWWEGRADAGLGWVWVKAPELAEHAILDALERGYFYTSMGPEIHALWIDGDRLHIRCSPVAHIDFIGSGIDGHRILPASGELLTQASQRIKPGSRFMRVAVRDADGLWAWSNPVFFDREAQSLA